MKTETAIEFLDKAVSDPTRGLPDSVFYYISRTTPLVNVDLLIKDDYGRTLLSWRKETHTGTGWHVPGGILRFKETLEKRIETVSLCEIGVPVQFNPRPIALHQLIHKGRGIRGHFISLLYKCFLSATYQPKNEGMSPNDAGYLKWHDRSPEDLLDIHEIYRKFINADLGREEASISLETVYFPQ